MAWRGMAEKRACGSYSTRGEASFAFSGCDDG